MICDSGTPLPFGFPKEETPLSFSVIVAQWPWLVTAGCLIIRRKFNTRLSSRGDFFLKDYSLAVDQSTTLVWLLAKIVGGIEGWFRKTHAFLSFHSAQATRMTSAAITLLCLPDGWVTASYHSERASWNLPSDQHSRSLGQANPKPLPNVNGETTPEYNVSGSLWLPSTNLTKPIIWPSSSLSQ